MEFIENNLDKPWHWGIISKNKDLTLEHIEKYIDKDWDWDDFISKNEFNQDYRNELKKLMFEKYHEDY